jgi:nicotinamide mononucleotide transporter
MSAIEWAAAAITLLSVTLSAKQNIWSWPTAILGVALYIDVFWRARLYADMGLQFFFIAISIYGWYEWLYGGKNATPLPVTRAPLRVHVAGALITIAIAIGFGYFLHRTTDAALPYIDSTLAWFSVLAQWQMARKYLENWFLWIAIDVGSIAMYLFKKLYVTAGLYAVFIVVCAMAYREWRASLRSAAMQSPL